MFETANLENLFIHVLNLNLSAAIIVLGILIIRPFLKKAPAWIPAALWSLAAFRLLCPFRFSSPASVLPSAETIPQNIAFMPAPSVNSGFPVLNSTVNEGLQTHFTPDPAASVNPLQIIQSVSTWLWLAGIAVCLGYLIISTLLLRRKLHTATLLRDNIRQSELAQTPFVFGFFRPRIYLPYDLPENALSFVIAHEQAHIARRDHLIKPLSFLLLSVNWFNPFLWLAYVLLCRDMENACDERVIRKMSLEERKSYSLALVDLSLPHRFPRTTPLAFGENNVRGRVKNILSYKRPGFWVILVSVLLCAAAVVCLGTERGKDTAFPFHDESVVVPSTEDENGFGTYETCECVYWNPILSYYPEDDDGCQYYFGKYSGKYVKSPEYRIGIYNKNDVNYDVFGAGEGANWSAVSAEEWDTIFKYGYIGISKKLLSGGEFDKTGWEQLDFEVCRLLRRDGELYIMHMMGTENDIAAWMHRLAKNPPPVREVMSYTTCEHLYAYPKSSYFMVMPYDLNFYYLGKSADGRYALSVFDEYSSSGEHVSFTHSWTGNCATDWEPVAEEDWAKLVLKHGMIVNGERPLDAKWDTAGWEQLDFGRCRVLRKDGELYIMSVIRGLDDTKTASRIHRLTENTVSLATFPEAAEGCWAQTDEETAVQLVKIEDLGELYSTDLPLLSCDLDFAERFGVPFWTLHNGNRKLDTTVMLFDENEHYVTFSLPDTNAETADSSSKCKWGKCYYGATRVDSELYGFRIRFPKQ